MGQLARGCCKSSAHATLTAAPYPPGQAITAHSLALVQWETFSTNDPSVFGTGDAFGNILNTAGDSYLIVQQVGTIVVRGWGFWEPGAYVHYFQFTSETAVTPDSDYVLTAPPAVGQGVTAVNSADAGQLFWLSAGNNDGSDHYIDNVRVEVLWVPGPGADAIVY